jgi:hypothetical protein
VERTAQAEVQNGTADLRRARVFCLLLSCRSERIHGDVLPARPNVGVEAGPTAEGQAREAHHAPRRIAGLVFCRWASPRTTG